MEGVGEATGNTNYMDAGLVFSTATAAQLRHPSRKLALDSRRVIGGRYALTAHPLASSVSTSTNLRRGHL